MLIGWCGLAAAVLIVSIVVHLSTFLGIDPMAKWPGVMFIHITIFPPFIAAIYYANRIGGPQQECQDKVMDAAPRWLQISTGVFFAYALVNFAIFMVLNEGGGPDERDGKYFLTSHGKALRELSEEEFHQQQAYVVRGFSGHWILFSSGALMLLAGAARLRRRSPEGSPPTLSSTVGQALAPVATAEGAEQAESKADAESHPEPASAREGVLSLVVYAACLAMILSGQPVLSMVALLPVIISMVLAMRRRHGFLHGDFESYLGCLALFPNAIIASVMGKRVAEFIYLAIYVGLGPALGHEVAVTFPEEGPAQFSNGEFLDNRVWAALMLFVQFPLFALGTVGLTYLAERVGRLVKLGRREKKTGLNRS